MACRVPTPEPTISPSLTTESIRSACMFRTLPFFALKLQPFLFARKCGRCRPGWRSCPTLLCPRELLSLLSASSAAAAQDPDLGPHGPETLASLSSGRWTPEIQTHVRQSRLLAHRCAFLLRPHRGGSRESTACSEDRKPRHAGSSLPAPSRRDRVSACGSGGTRTSSDSTCR